MGLDRSIEKVEDRAALLHAGGNHRPDPLAPALAGFATRALGDAPVDHHEADRLFGQVVGRLDAGCGDESEVGLAVSAKPVGQILGVVPFRNPLYLR